MLKIIFYSENICADKFCWSCEIISSKNKQLYFFFLSWAVVINYAMYKNYTDTLHSIITYNHIKYMTSEKCLTCFSLH